MAYVSNIYGMRVARSDFLVLRNKANTNDGLLRRSCNDWVELFGGEGLSCQAEEYDAQQLRHSARGEEGGGGAC